MGDNIIEDYNKMILKTSKYNTYYIRIHLFVKSVIRLKV